MVIKEVQLLYKCLKLNFMMIVTQKFQFYHNRCKLTNSKYQESQKICLMVIITQNGILVLHQMERLHSNS